MSQGPHCFCFVTWTKRDSWNKVLGYTLRHVDAAPTTARHTQQSAARRTQKCLCDQSMFSGAPEEKKMEEEK